MRTERAAVALMLSAALALSGCQPFEDGPRQRPARDRSGSTPPPPVSGSGEFEMRPEPRSRYGNPESYEVFGERYYVMDSADGYRERGIASWYGPNFHGRLTSNREVFDMNKVSAAHKSLPLPTWVQVTNLRNGRSIVVRVNDRGPFKDDRIIDLSREAARRIGMIEDGTALVEVVALDPRRTDSAAPSTLQPPAPSTPPSASGGRDRAPLPEPDADTPHIEVTPEQVVAESRREMQPPPVVTAVREDLGDIRDDQGLPPVGTPQLYLQLGAFGDRGNAERLMDRIGSLADVGVRVVGEVRDDDLQLWKVQVGPVPTVAEFDGLTARLRAAGFEEMHITIE